MEQMPKYLEDPNVRLYTTPCVVMETEGLGPKAYGAMRVVKQFKVRKCGHEKNETISAEECILSMVRDNNPEHLMVATTDPQLSSKCRLLPGVPLLYISYNAINLEKPSDLSIGIANKNMKVAVEIPQEQKKTLQQLKPAEERVPIRKKRKAKGPNPLSCKKKKMKPNPKVPMASQTDKAAKKKRHKKTKKAAFSSEASNSMNSS
ncbi:rRNA-processing protein UTP23 like protein [Argiope bruennichi]|uniref:rRNA-processing protein UTP23 like protein n=1 Tax=Argiope bruennichi TaxID=94029 RepID=A0A8T0DZU8_ARGBR|nr:rRNA-processing protein UTP23 like protein [Argiope bruennichi]